MQLVSGLLVPQCLSFPLSDRTPATWEDLVPTGDATLLGQGERLAQSLGTIEGWHYRRAEGRALCWGTFDRQLTAFAWSLVGLNTAPPTDTRAGWGLRSLTLTPKTLLAPTVVGCPPVHVLDESELGSLQGIARLSQVVYNPSGRQ